MINHTRMVETFEEIYGTVGDMLDEETWSCWLGIWAVAWEYAEEATLKAIAESQKIPEEK